MGIHEVAAMLGRSVNAVRIYIKADDLPHRRAEDGRRLLFDVEEVREWRSRPEIDAMFKIGEHLKAGHRVTA